MSDLEKKVQSLETALSEAQSACRRLAGEDTNLLSMIQKLTTEVGQLKVEVQKLVKSGVRSGASMGRYE